MRYLLGIVIPPLGMLSVGKPVQAVICLVLMVTLIGWIPASIWALLTINAAFADERSKKLIDSQRKQTDRIIEATGKPLPSRAAGPTSVRGDFNFADEVARRKGGPPNG